MVAAAIGAFSVIVVFSLGLVFLKPAIDHYFVLSREEPCMHEGGWWNDAQRRCYYLDCAGRSGEQKVPPAPEMKCFVQMRR